MVLLLLSYQPSKDFQKFGYTIVVFCFIDKSVDDKIIKTLFSEMP